MEQLGGSNRGEGNLDCPLSDGKPRHPIELNGHTDGYWFCRWGLHLNLFKLRPYQRRNRCAGTGHCNFGGFGSSIAGLGNETHPSPLEKEFQSRVLAGCGYTVPPLDAAVDTPEKSRCFLGVSRVEQGQRRFFLWTDCLDE